MQLMYIRIWNPYDNISDLIYIFKTIFLVILAITMENFKGEHSGIRTGLIRVYLNFKHMFKYSGWVYLGFSIRDLNLTPLFINFDSDSV